MPRCDRFVQGYFRTLSLKKSFFCDVNLGEKGGMLGLPL